MHVGGRNRVTGDIGKGTARLRSPIETESFADKNGSGKTPRPQAASYACLAGRWGCTEQLAEANKAAAYSDPAPPPVNTSALEALL